MTVKDIDVDIFEDNNDILRVKVRYYDSNKAKHGFMLKFTREFLTQSEKSFIAEGEEFPTMTVDEQIME